MLFTAQGRESYGTRNHSARRRFAERCLGIASAEVAKPFGNCLLGTFCIGIRILLNCYNHLGNNSLDMRPSRFIREGPFY